MNDIKIAESTIEEYSKGILNWYTFHRRGKVLYIVSDVKKSKKYGISNLLHEIFEEVIEAGEIELKNNSFLLKYTETFDYIIGISVIEYIVEPLQILNNLKKLLNLNGRMLLGVNNRLGSKYFCGDRDLFTNKVLDGVDHYMKIPVREKERVRGQMYSRSEIISLLSESGFKNNKVHSVLPNLEMPQLIYAEGILPEEDLSMRYFPRYNHPESIFLEEQFLYDDLIKNNLFHAMANAYLIECSIDNTFDNVNQVTLSMDRGREKSFATIIRSDRSVEKKALYTEGIKRLKQLHSNLNEIEKNGLCVIKGMLVKDSYKMSYCDGKLAILHLRKLAKYNIPEYEKEIDRFIQLVLNSSKHVSQDNGNGDLGVILEKGYIDLVPWNCFYNSGEYIFFDQEFYEENYPANAIIYRAIEGIYLHKFEIEQIIPMQYFLEKYNLEEQVEVWKKYNREFIDKLRNRNTLNGVINKGCCNARVVDENRKKLNYSSKEYQDLFVDIFNGIGKKKIFVFGAGNIAQRFIAQFKRLYSVDGIIDNDIKKWGNKVEGIIIYSPEHIKNLDKEMYRVIICIKNYWVIEQQLIEMDVKDYKIFDTTIDYPRINRIVNDAEKSAVDKKKYEKGYIAGVFDLFHIGHVNLLRRAKEQCEYLIVGIVSDEGVRRFKHTEPFIPFEERLEMVESCRYVDEVVEIPLIKRGTIEAYEMYHFDCQFSGSDYQHDPGWLENREYLRSRGSDIVFLPYTEKTSSTKIKKMIEESLL